jgi:hypothetical protein
VLSPILDVVWFPTCPWVYGVGCPQGVHPSEIVLGYAKAAEKVDEFLPSTWVVARTPDACAAVLLCAGPLVCLFPS